ncbi:hypothetical protein V8F20_009981 [Naviculisporaceae sp. PSN 640]
MSLTNPPSAATGPGPGSAARAQTLKRSVQAAFEGTIYEHASFPIASSRPRFPFFSYPFVVLPVRLPLASCRIPFSGFDM